MVPFRLANRHLIKETYRSERPQRLRFMQGPRDANVISSPTSLGTAPAKSLPSQPVSTPTTRTPSNSMRRHARLLLGPAQKASSTITKNFYAGALQVAKMAGSAVYYLHHDALGSTRLVATSTVSIKLSSNYVPYGNNYAVSGKEVFMYTGKMDDTATGLYYYGARFYDSTIGRFVTQDSKAGDKKDPMTMNLYIYARDNPEKYNDPSGHTINGRSFTDYDASALGDQMVTTSTCVNGVCTVTTTETYKGYTSVISSTLGSLTDSSGTKASFMGTTFVDRDPAGVTRVSTSSTTPTTTPSNLASKINHLLTDISYGLVQTLDSHSSPSIGFAMSLADAFVAPITVVLQDYSDASQGGWTIQASVNTGLVIGAGLAMVACPEVTIPMLIIWGLVGGGSYYGL